VEKTILPQQFQRHKAINKLSSEVLHAKNIFTTIGISNSLPLFLNDHLNRLEKGHKHFFGEHFPRKEIEQDIKKIPLNEYNSLKITLYSDFYVFTLRKVKTKNEIRLCLFQNKKFENTFPNDIKHGNYLHRLRQLELSQEQGFDDALELDTNDFVLETSIRNIFFYDGHKIIIPKSELIFKGITIEKIKTLFDFELRPISFLDMIKYKYVMTCNSVRGIENVSQIGPHSFSTTDEVKLRYNHFVSDKGSFL
jgi:branched-subunit amino acid aminotransferase/4-amino-4-deoxychorismate lyase